MKSKKYWVQILISIPIDHQDLLVGQLAVLGFGGFLQEDDILSCYLVQQHWTTKLESSFRDLLARFQKEFPQLKLSFQKRIVRDKNWNAIWERGIGIVEATNRIIIKPSWKKLRARDKNKIVIHIDPKMSFGTGHHETTRLSLALLEKYLQPDMAVLDVGTGTGILAIAAAKLGAASAFGVDIDDWAVLNAKENIKRNRESKRVKIVLGGIEKIPKRKFDLIIANIDLPTIRTVFPRFAKKAHPHGIIILSGLLTGDLAPVLDILQSEGIAPLEIVNENEWVALALTKAYANINN
ncbi:MAG: 50S ribosomal protein L11 methyltransferase [Ignavibacteriales bacterium]|nr:50S ribosomal protein L11 methyltransferase [Ignavibacteriales bacterium]